MGDNSQIGDNLNEEKNNNGDSATIEGNKTIQIKIGQGIVQSVEGLPDGYLYEVIECDKYGDPIEPED